MKSIRSAIFLLAFYLFGAAAALAGPVNINTADAATLAAELTGIGPVLAQEIVRDRELNGRYATADDLVRVKGVGQRIVDQNRDNIHVDDSHR